MVMDSLAASPYMSPLVLPDPIIAYRKGSMQLVWHGQLALGTMPMLDREVAMQHKKKLWRKTLHMMVVEMRAIEL
ncbi:hypothetical protein GYH30_006677 [Glycine max]|nr:hypothetical protein GYH30_006677 [Glycine max]